MSEPEFVVSVMVVCATMAAVTGIELAVPLFLRTAEARGRACANLGLTGLTFALNGALDSAAALIALAFALGEPGVMARLGIPLAVQIAAGIVVLDFSYGYLAHRAMHGSPLLWRVHRVHHSDPFVDVTTSYRTHPIEGFWRFLFLIVPVWILGVPVEGVVIYRLLSAINGIFEHANIRLWAPIDRALSLVWVTPNMHKVHHSRLCIETDSNYGNILSIHDRLLRTFTPTARALAVRYGLDVADPAQVKSLRALLMMPFEPIGAAGAAPLTRDRIAGTSQSSIGIRASEPAH
jgi:sterol desaturase/sphingolipid hydroxylase (fatty acid hydroxylase superfamily)